MICVLVHASSTAEFGAMRSDCLVQFSILNPFSEPMNCVFVHVSSSFEFGAMRSDCLVHFSILNLFFSPMNCVFVHASSTNESAASRIDCLGLFAYPPFSTFIRSPMNCLSFIHPPPSSLQPHELIAKCKSIS